MLRLFLCKILFFSHNIHVEGLLFSRPWVCDWLLESSFSDPLVPPDPRCLLFVVLYRQIFNTCYVYFDVKFYFPQHLLLRVSFSPVPECVVADCWNRAFPNPRASMAPLSLLLSFSLMCNTYLNKRLIGECVFLEGDLHYTKTLTIEVYNLYKRGARKRNSILIYGAEINRPKVGRGLIYNQKTWRLGSNSRFIADCLCSQKLRQL